MMDQNEKNNTDYTQKDAIKAVILSGTIILTIWVLSFIIK